MTEQYKDAYQSKYREETAQVHAPLRLIEKTKAAMREEEKRLAAAAQGKESGAASEREVSAGMAPAGTLGMQEKREEMLVSNTEYGNRKKQSLVASARKWTYPLTAAAAILILVSVSLTMRGMKSANRLDTARPACDEPAESGAVYEEAAADEGYEAAEAPAAEMPVAEFATGAAESVEDMAEAPAEAPAAEDIAEEPAADRFAAQDAAQFTDGGQTNGLLREDAAAEEMMKESAEKENSERDPAEKSQQKSAADAKKEEMAGEREQEAGDQDDLTIEKVTRRPTRFGGADVKTHRYEGKDFRVLETTLRGDDSRKAWEAYVEISAKERYVISGEAENAEDFLAAAWEMLEKETQ